MEMEVKLIPEFSSEIFLLQSLKRRKFKTKKFYIFEKRKMNKATKAKPVRFFFSVRNNIGPVWFVGPLTLIINPLVNAEIDMIRADLARVHHCHKFCLC